jgi:membrane-associated phospholipid phosphatase
MLFGFKVDYIGVYGSITLFILTLFFLRNSAIYSKLFLAGFILSNALNTLLKMAIKDPRPINESRVIEIAVTNGKRFKYDIYGMPSGHAQNCGFCITFVTLVLKNFYVTTLYAIISIITVLQRFLYKNHTSLQLLIGFLVGSGFGYIIYSLSSLYIRGDMKPKKDDDAPM